MELQKVLPNSTVLFLKVLNHILTKATQMSQEPICLTLLI